MKRLLILIALAALTNSAEVYAAGEGTVVNDDLVVTDCKGNVRATAQVAAGALSMVQISLDGAAGDTKISLTQSDREKKVAVAQTSSVSFESVTAGKWSACLDNSNVAITNVSILPENTTALSSLPLIGLSTLGGGLAVAGIAGGTSSGSESTGPVTSLVGQSSSVIEGSGNSPEVATSAARSSSASDCLNSEIPDPLSPFF